MVPCPRKFARVGALEPEDGLFEITNHEEGSDRVGLCSRTCEKLFCDCFDNVPLRRICVLRLIDQNMINCLIELELDPVANAGFLEQFDGASDQIVEVNDTCVVLGVGICAGIITAQMQRIDDRGGKARDTAESDQLVDPRIEAFSNRPVIRIVWLCFAPLTAARQPCSSQFLQLIPTLLHFSSEPSRYPSGGFDPVRARCARFCHPPCEDALQGFEPFAVKTTVGTGECNCFIDWVDPAGQLPPDKRIKPVPHRQTFHRLRRAGAAPQEGSCRSFAQALSRRFQPVKRAVAPFAHIAVHQVGQGARGQLFLFPPFHWTETCWQSRFSRKIGKQCLAETVDGLNAQARPARIEDASEQVARLFATSGANHFAQIF